MPHHSAVHVIAPDDTNSEDPDGPSSSTVPQQLLRRLLCPFRAIIAFIFFDSFVPTDTFMIKLRKVITGCMLLGVLSFITNFLDFFNTMHETSSQEQLLYAYVELVLYDLLPLLSLLISFIYCRLSMSAPDWVIGLPSLLLLLSQLFYGFTTATIDLAIPIVVVFTVVSMTIGRWWYSMCLGSSLIALTVNGLTISRTVTVWIIPGSRAPYAPQQFLNYLSNQIFLFCIVSYFMYTVVSEFGKMIDSAQGAASLSQNLATKLLRYDTDGAKELLSRCVKSGCRDRAPEGALVVDAQLLEAFNGIVKNLEQYRPYLPNYLLVADDQTEEDPTTEHAADAATTAVLMVSGAGESERHTIDLAGSQRSHHSEDDHQSVQAYLETTADENSPPTTFSPVQRFMVGGGGGHFGDDSPGGGSGGTMHPSKVTVTLADISILASIHDRKYLFDAVVSTMNDLATLTHASIHSFIGDRLIATWNATKRVSKPEGRACAFAIRLRDAFNRGNRMSFASMTATGPAESCVAGDQRLRLFACSSVELWGVVREGLEQTKHLRVAAIDAATRDQATVDVTSRGLTLLKGPGAPKCLYELREERPQEERDQEWMYVLEQHADDPDEKVTHALHAYAFGRPREGVETLAQLKERDLPVEMLMSEMEAASRAEIVRPHPTTDIVAPR